MYFVNLDKMKIEKQFQFQTFSTELGNIDFNNNIYANKQNIKEKCKTILENKSSISTLYNFDIVNESLNDEDFIGFVNLILCGFFECIVTEGGRRRERRLDIPEKLQKLHISQGLLKRAINYQTTIDNFNITINCGDFHYILIDNNKGE